MTKENSRVWCDFKKCYLKIEIKVKHMISMIMLLYNLCCNSFLFHLLVLNKKWEASKHTMLHCSVIHLSVHTFILFLIIIRLFILWSIISHVTWNSQINEVLFKWIQLLYCYYSYQVAFCPTSFFWFVHATAVFCYIVVSKN